MILFFLFKSDDILRRKGNLWWLFYSQKSSLITFLFQQNNVHDFSKRKDHGWWLLKKRSSMMIIYNDFPIKKGNRFWPVDYKISVAIKFLYEKVIFDLTSDFPISKFIVDDFSKGKDWWYWRCFVQILSRWLAYPILKDHSSCHIYKKILSVMIFL